MLKLSLIGAASTGKTTVYEACKQAFPEYNFIPEQVRVLMQELGYTSLYDMDVDPIAFRFQILKRQILCEKQYSNFIADRGTIDAWVYFRYWLKDNQDLNQTQKQNYLNEFENQAKKAALQYDKIVFFPIMFDLVEDGIRYNNPEYQNSISELMLQQVNDWGLNDKLYIIRTKTLIERVQEIRALLFGESNSLL